MEISGGAASASIAKQVQLAEQVQISVLSKAMDIQATNAQQLIDALPQPAVNPDHLGQNVDIRA